MPILRRVNKDFFKRWSPEMAYVLGFFVADGNMIETKRGGRYISFYSSDRAILLSIKTAMGSEHKVSKRNKSSGNVFRLQIGSKELFSDLVELGLTSVKSRRMRLPMIPKEFFEDFVRGYFDGDGNVWMGFINKKRKNPNAVLQLSFTSSSLGFLYDLLGRLKSGCGVVGGSIFAVKNKNASRLTLGTSDALKVYNIMYNGMCSLFLSRKRDVFLKFTKMRA